MIQIPSEHERITGMPNKSIRLPNFLIIGAPKAGTTSLYRYLAEHPKVFMSPLKEPKFFAIEGQDVDYSGPGDDTHEYITDYETYLSLFDSATSETALGEASPWYLHMRGSAERIHSRIPNVKIVAILRDPVERAYSQFCMHKGYSHEPISDFESAWQAEAKRMSDNWSPRWFYRDRGLYYAQLRRYFDIFDKDQIRVYLFEDLERDSLAVAQDIYEFLGVDNHFVPDTSQRFNARRTAGISSLYHALGRSRRIRSIANRLARSSIGSELIHVIKKISLHGKLPLSSATRCRLIEEYRDDIVQLSGLIDRDLSQWLKT